ncbi:heavy metal translocating P-type ATPase [Schlesneria sp. T3-172]|uniref:heavy metal translocating P-type ATPase n=1 Tax=Schlesneria sphaerica TaxID=3373610 RepID=UPI0037C6CE71
MFDCEVLACEAGALKIQSDSLFSDLSSTRAKAILGCILGADPDAEISITGGGATGRKAVAEIRHNHASPTGFLKSIVARIRSLVEPPATASTPTDIHARDQKPVYDGVLTGRPVVAGDGASVKSHRGSRNGQVAGQNGTTAHSSAERAPSVSLADILLMPDRKGVTRVGRNGNHATAWEIIHEIPGRLRLKHPALYRRKDVCQSIERELMSMLGVDSYKTRSSTGTLLVTYNQRDLRKDQVITILDRAIARAELSPHLDPPDLDFPLAIASVPLAAVAQFAFPPLLPVAGLLFGYTSITTFKEAYHVLVHERRLGVDVLDAIVVTGCVITGQIFAGSVLCLCLSFGRMLVKKTQDDSKRLLVQAFGKQAQFVRLLRDGEEVETPLDELKKGDVIVVHTGDAVPVDGVVKDGMAMIDQHALTGESTPSEKSPGDKVFASTLMVAGKVYVEVENAGSETTSSKIAQILNDSAGYKLTSQHKGERMADKAVIPTLAIATAGMATLGPQGAVAILNSDFGTGIRMAAPLGMLTSLALCAHKGILVKDGRALELMNDIDTVLFDKTGTLTRERPEVGHIIPFNGHERNRLLQLVASAEQRFSHPIAKSIVLEFEKTGMPMLPIDDSKYQVGYGLEAVIDGHTVKVGSIRYIKLEQIEIPMEVQEVVEVAHREGHTLVMVALDGVFAGVIELRASQRPEVISIIKGLRDRGIKHIAIISGDHEGPTKKLAESLGMDEYFAGVLPGDKADYVERLQKQGRKVCFVGDGINDSIALKKANVSISLRGASSIATDTAQIVFMEESLHRLCELRDIARDLDKNVRNSWYLILAPNLLCIAGAFTMGFGIMASVITNNVAAMAALANGMMPLKRIADEQAMKQAQKEMTLLVTESLDAAHKPQVHLQPA